MLAGCEAGEAPKSLEELAAEKCPRVHLDRMEGDWLLFAGKAEPKNRMRIEREGDDITLYYVAGVFQKLRLKGERRDQDIQFTEIPTAARAQYVDRGEATLTRLYVTPAYKTCSLAVNLGTVTKDGKEQVSPKTVEFVAFPKTDVVFSYLPADAPLFVGKAAKDRKVAEQELKKNGAPSGEFQGNPVPLGLWSQATDDGDDSCTYDMDLYFDDQRDDKLTKVPAGDVKDGQRHWFHEWDADYGGNHYFEMLRYRTCGGDRELIGVGASEVTLF